MHGGHIYILFEPTFLNNLSGYHSHLIFEKLVNMSSELYFEIREEDNVTKPTESYKSLKRGCSKILDYYRSLDASSDNLSATLNFFPHLQMRMEGKVNFS